jgi:hypothetical protein
VSDFLCALIRSRLLSAVSLSAGLVWATAAGAARAGCGDQPGVIASIVDQASAFILLIRHQPTQQARTWIRQKNANQALTTAAKVIDQAFL